MFLGVYEVNYDSKCRITVPLSFRNLLSSSSIRLSKVKVFDLPVVAVFPTDEVLFSHILDYFDITKDSNDYKRDLSIMVRKSVKLDNAGRICISNMIDAEPREKLMVVGNFDLFEIWKRTDFDEYCRIKNLHL